MIASAERKDFIAKHAKEGNAKKALAQACNNPDRAI
jgi:hypothetical protein